MNHAGTRPPHRLWLHRCRRQALAWQIRAAWRLRQLGLPLPRASDAAAFDRFKRLRSRLCGSDLSALRVPAEQGLVSILLPVYNGEDYLAEALGSIRSQTYPLFELIAVDDGSTDRTPEILADAAARDPRVRVITQENRRLPAALSRGFQEARGEFLTWTSADNRLRPEFLERMVGCLRRHPQWDMIYANEDMIDAAGRPLRHAPWYPLYQRPLDSEHLYFPHDVSYLNVRFNNYVGGAFLYRACVKYLIGDYAPWAFGLEDYDYWMRVNALLTLRHADFDEPVYEYRFHASSLTSRANELQARERCERLLALDALRRELHSKPLAWKLDVPASHAGSARLAAALRAALQQRGQVVLDAEQAGAQPESHSPSPVVSVRIVTNPVACGMAQSHVAEPALRVLVAATHEPLPERMPPEWDLCLALTANGPPPLLRAPNQGWLATQDLQVLLAAIDVCARSRCTAGIQDLPPAL